VRIPVWKEFERDRDTDAFGARWARPSDVLSDKVKRDTGVMLVAAEGDRVHYTPSPEVADDDD
jgi:hypothetical protein